MAVIVREGKRRLVINEIAELLTPLAGCVHRKAEQCIVGDETIEQVDNLLIEISECSSMERHQELLDELDELEEKIDDHNK